MNYEKVDFQGHLNEKRVYQLKVLKKLYIGHLNGTYRFRIRNGGNCGSKLLKSVKFCSTFRMLTTSLLEHGL